MKWSLWSTGATLVQGWLYAFSMGWRAKWLPSTPGWSNWPSSTVRRLRPENSWRLRTVRHLLALRQTYVQYISPMREFHTQAAEWSPTQAMIKEDLAGLNVALSALAQTNPAIQVIAAPLTPAVAWFTANMADFSATIGAQAELLPADIAAMQAVVDTVMQAEGWESWLTVPPLDLIGKWARSNLLLFLSTSIIGLMAAAILTLFVVRRESASTMSRQGGGNARLRRSNRSRNRRHG